MLATGTEDNAEAQRLRTEMYLATLSLLPIAANSRSGQVLSRPTSRVRSPGSSTGAVVLRSQTALTGSDRSRTIPAAGAGMSPAQLKLAVRQAARLLCHSREPPGVGAAVAGARRRARRGGGASGPAGRLETVQKLLTPTRGTTLGDNSGTTRETTGTPRGQGGGSSPDAARDTARSWAALRSRRLSAPGERCLSGETVDLGEWVPRCIFVYLKLGSGRGPVCNVLAEQVRQQRGGHVHACRDT